MSFDRLAPHYTWMERVLAGNRLQRCRLAWLDQLDGCREILIAGVGHGHFLQRCATRHPRARITSYDASALMLQHARRRAQSARPGLAGLEFVHASIPDAATPAAAGTFDAIVTHFFLDCFAPPELERVVHWLAVAAGPQARWVLSDFALPAQGLARQRARFVHALMYAFFRRVTRLPARRLTEPDALLQSHGFALARRTASDWGLLRADLWSRREADGRLAGPTTVPAGAR